MRMNKQFVDLFRPAAVEVTEEDGLKEGPDLEEFSASAEDSTDEKKAERFVKLFRNPAALADEIVVWKHVQHRTIRLGKLASPDTVAKGRRIADRHVIVQFGEEGKLPRCRISFGSREHVDQKVNDE